MRKRLDAGTTMLLAALAIGAVTRLWQLTSGSVYVDEAHTFEIASRTLPNILWMLAATDYHPPLFYVGTHFLRSLDLQQTSYRYFTAPLALATIAATWAIARKLAGPIAAGIAAIIIAIDPSAILWDRIYRMYVVLDALVAASWWLLITAEKAEGRRRTALWIAFAACSVVQPYLHYLGIINVFCQALYAVPRLRTTWPAATSAVASAIAFLPWVPYALKQIPGGGLVAGTASVPIEWSTIARDAVLSGSPLGWIQTPGFDVGLTLVVVAVSVWVAVATPASTLGYWLLVAALQVALSVVTGKFLAAPRYLLPVLPVFAIGIGLLVERLLLLPKARVVGIAAGAAVIAMLGYCSTNVLFDPRYQFADWNIVRSILAQHARPSDAVVFDQGYSIDALAQDAQVGALTTDLVNGPVNVTSERYWLDEQATRRVWYIENEFYYVDPDRQVIAYLESTRPQLGQWLEPRVELSNRVYVVLFGPERPTHPASR